ncbi:MAG: bifunctional nuclease family protein [Acidimicrobiales bacterium]
MSDAAEVSAGAGGSSVTTESERPGDPEGSIGAAEAVEAAEAMETIDAVEPAEPAEATEPAEPAEATEPAEPAEATEPAEPAEATEPAEVEAAEEPLGFELPPAMSRMMFVDVMLVLPSTHPVVVLQESDLPYRELRIPIGGPEGIAIGYAARQIATPRPLTHELMSQLLERFSLTLDVVRITGLTGGVFTAEIVVSGPTGSRTLDCRPSDAIALALRQRLPVPIMADPDVLDRAASGAAGSN